ncbi:MAG TPA: Uma2 family endonuclease [Isosphaeraceae bacterium]|jgi:Uma2 family endonuclease|nr:Uma2 family endonuclease [Isosphaeraceae bacterium]
MATVTLRIGPADHGRAMTLDDFLDAEEEPGYRYELANGVLEVTNVPNDPHGLIIWFLLDALSEFGRRHPGLILRAGGSGEFQLRLPGLDTGRNPDVAVVLHGTPKDERGRRPPSLVMEVVSEGADAHERDYVAKRREYLAVGLREYWIIDPIERRVTVLVRDGDVWAERIFVGDAAAEGLVLPGFRLPLAELWEQAEE